MEKEYAASAQAKTLGKQITRECSYFARHWPLYIMVLPAVVYILIFAYKPMYGIVIAFKTYNFRAGILGSPWCGLENFQRLFHSYWLSTIVKNTLTISLLTLVLGFPFPILLALMMNELSSESLKRTLQTVSYAPHFISTVVMCGILNLLLGNTGIVNRVVGSLGGQMVDFLQDPSLFKWVYVLSGVWQEAGWAAVIYFAALSAVDKQLLEAADIDGASRLQKIWYINLPVLVPTITIMFILNCGGLLSVGYEKVYLLQTAPNISASEVISTYVYKVGLVQSDFGFSTATNLLNSVINSILLLIVNGISAKIGQSSLW